MHVRVAIIEDQGEVRDFLNRGRAPNGFDLQALKADLELVTA